MQAVVAVVVSLMITAMVGVAYHMRVVQPLQDSLVGAAYQICTLKHGSDDARCREIGEAIGVK